ncbi:16S rRNA (guanine(966)-N(2))-methyltransferase RsmD [Thermovenabulum sp.]|uniref:16S rRNA (guanine(966)-N(2))-methyltransferase RsmD n=1 Tax=Thermovenabulum sp. TaxID=3100335 RepID=UPI003C7BC793
MRIIGGTLRGRKLKSLKGMKTRPTSAMVREALFNILGEKVINSIFLDAYAGTGAVGIEAISRGAKKVYFIEKDKEACRVIKENIKTLGVVDQAVIIRGEIPEIFYSITEKDDFDIIFLDPPYGDFNIACINTLKEEGFIRTNTLVILQCSFNEKINLTEEFSVIKEKKYGITKLIFFRRN